MQSELHPAKNVRPGAYRLSCIWMMADSNELLHFLILAPPETATWCTLPHGCLTREGRERAIQGPGNGQVSWCILQLVPFLHKNVPHVLSFLNQIALDNMSLK
ncbi:unnamed protein product, partial [Sphacelaria rigidula]